MRGTRPPVGVLLMAHGSPAGPSALTDYLTSVRGGRPPGEEAVREAARRYAAIGGISPLMEITRRQGTALQERLDASDPGGFRVYIGTRHSRPSIAEAVRTMAADGLERGVGLVLAPHYSRMGVGAYIAAVEAAAHEIREGGSSDRAGGGGRPAGSLEMACVERWGSHPLLIGALAERLRGALCLGGEGERSAAVVFTAHSLPERIAAWQDPYPEEVAATCRAVADAAGVRRWVLAYQSGGRTGEPWLGPDVREVLRDLGARGAASAVICPVGFVSDHLEVLYDLDIECKELCDSLGVRYERTDSLNDHEGLIAALAELATDSSRLGGQGQAGRTREG